MIGGELSSEEKCLTYCAAQVDWIFSLWDMSARLCFFLPYPGWKLPSLSLHQLAPPVEGII